MEKMKTQKNTAHSSYISQLRISFDINGSISEYNLQTSNTNECKNIRSVLEYAKKVSGPYVIKIS